MSIPGKKYFVIGSLEKGIQVLELLADRDALSVSQVSAALGLNRSSAHRFLATLRELGYVDKDDEGKYRLTFRILEQAMKMADRFEIRRLARPSAGRIFLGRSDKGGETRAERFSGPVRQGRGDFLGRSDKGGEIFWAGPTRAGRFSGSTAIPS